MPARAVAPGALAPKPHRDALQLGFPHHLQMPVATQRPACHTGYSGVGCLQWRQDLLIVFCSAGSALNAAVERAPSDALRRFFAALRPEPVLRLLGGGAVGSAEGAGLGRSGRFFQDIDALSQYGPCSSGVAGADTREPEGCSTSAGAAGSSATPLGLSAVGFGGACRWTASELMVPWAW